MDQQIINLFDRFTHGAMNRRDFFEKLAVLAGGMAAATSLLAALEKIMPKPPWWPRTTRPSRRK